MHKEKIQSMRLLLGSALLLIAGIAIGVSMSHGLTLDDFLLNLGTELVGIVLTIAFVDQILERRKNEESAKKIAWEALHDLDHAVWVWQGGAREFDLDELAGLLTHVTDSDPLPQFTQNLFLRIGCRADNTLRTRGEAMSANPHLKNAMQILKPLSRMRDDNRLLSVSEINDIAGKALAELAKAVGSVYSVQNIEVLSAHRDVTVKAQEWRHYGNDKGIA